jgi:protein-disulfide isomerase
MQQMASREEEKESRREERQRAEEQARDKERRQRLIKLTSAAGFLAIIAVVLAIVISQSGGSDESGGTDLKGVTTVQSQLKGLPQNGPVIGDPGAKVTLIEYGDLQCTTCGFYAQGIIPSLLSGPVRSGEAKIEFRPWTIIGPESNPAAEGAYAAGQQGRFWSYIEIFYHNQGGENSGYVTDDFMTAVAKAAGVKDIGQWNDDRRDPRWKRMIDQHDQQANALGFTGTPSFTVTAGGPAKPVPQGANSPSSLGQLETAIQQAG